MIAATNLPDRVDTALLRPNRLEKTVHISKPCLADIPGIIRHHMPAGADLSKIQQASVACRGRSQAEIAKSCRDARRIARTAGRVVSAADVCVAIDAARPRMSASDDRRAAIHESGHAVVAVVCGRALDYVNLDACLTVTPVEKLPGSEAMTAHVMIGLAGRAAEDLILGQPCIGAEEDLKNATDLVRRCLTQFGYGGNVSHVSDADYRLRGDLVHAVEQRVDELYKRTVSVAEKAKPLIEKVADRLQRDRYLDGSQVRRAMTYCSILHRKAPDTRYSAPVDAERGRPDNRCRIKWSAAA